MIHKMKLKNEPYNQIMCGAKSIELRLYDEKRESVSVNDIIIFINIETKKQIAVKVLELHRADSFKELFDSIDKEKAGFKADDTIDDMVAVMRAIYSSYQEKSYGVVGIEISKPGYEVEFPTEIDDAQTGHITILPVCGNKLMLCKRDSDRFLIPSGFINCYLNRTEEVRRIFETETKMKSCGLIYPIAAYRIAGNTNDKKIIAGKLYIAEVQEESADEENVRFVEAVSQEKYTTVMSDLPGNIAETELFAVFLLTLQRMMINCDLGGFCDVYDAECYNYSDRIKCYDDEVFFDYEHFDADAFAFYVMMRSDIDDIYGRLARVPATEENFRSIRDELFSVNSIEYVEWIVENFGAERIRSDEELLENIYYSYSSDYIDELLNDE